MWAVMSNQVSLVTVCGTGGLTSLSQLFSTKMERVDSMESTRGVMHQCWHTYGRSGIMRRTNQSYLSWEPHIYVFLVSVQYTLATECFQLGYNAEGHCKGEVDASLAEPQKLNWEISSEVCFQSLLYVNNQKIHHQEYHTSGIPFCRFLNKFNFYSQNIVQHLSLF